MSDDPQALAPGFTFVRSFVLATDPASGDCTLTLHLAEDTDDSSPAVTVEFEGVTRLTLADVAGGHWQICCLAVEDISDQQLDRLNHRIVDLEDGRLEFLCWRYAVQR